MLRSQVGLIPDSDKTFEDYGDFMFSIEGLAKDMAGYLCDFGLGKTYRCIEPGKHYHCFCHQHAATFERIEECMEKYGDPLAEFQTLFPKIDTKFHGLFEGLFLGHVWFPDDRERG